VDTARSQCLPPTKMQLRRLSLRAPHSNTGKHGKDSVCSDVKTHLPRAARTPRARSCPPGSCVHEWYKDVLARRKQANQPSTVLTHPSVTEYRLTALEMFMETHSAQSAAAGTQEALGKWMSGLTQQMQPACKIRTVHNAVVMKTSTFWAKPPCRPFCLTRQVTRLPS
jgi:hypothetical protein